MPRPISFNSTFVPLCLLSLLFMASTKLHAIEGRGWITSPLPAALPEPFPSGVSPEDQEVIKRDYTRAAANLLALSSGSIESNKTDHLSDACVLLKAVRWALRFESSLNSNDVALIKRALAQSHARIVELGSATPSWTRRHGPVLRGYRSKVDDSIQPYGVIVPKRYDGQTPIRLDVVLHGSSKPSGMSELRFAARFNATDESNPAIPEAPFIELHPLGRVENCYRWAGETDVFESIAAVCRQYRIDPERIVLRGMSMGASGTWHLGLKYPDRFVAIGPYCGYVDTHRFSETPIPGFIRVGPLPWHQEWGLHLLDSVDYAANAHMVPAIAAIGDKDVFFQAHVIMREALARENIDMVNLISPGTGHVIDPVTHREQLSRIERIADVGLNHFPKEIQFATWSLKYSRCHWIELLGLEQHYRRADVHAFWKPDGRVVVTQLRNVTRFSIAPPLLHHEHSQVEICGQIVQLPSKRRMNQTEPFTFVKQQERWAFVPPEAATTGHLQGKQPGLQGPIDDAFTDAFLCVRGTGTPWNPTVENYARASLERFRHEWACYMRGELPVKNDSEVTADDIKHRHLILFGDPGSNRWIRKALPNLPLTWTRDTVTLGGVSRSAHRHTPILINPNPLNPNGRTYLVLNSGHSFHEAEFAAFNYLLFPRWGDWALVECPSAVGAPSNGGGLLRDPETMAAAGYFDETWWQPVRPGP